MGVAEILAAPNVRLVDGVDARVGLGTEVTFDSAFHAPVRNAPPCGDPVIEIPACVIKVVARGRNVAGVRRICVDAVELEHGDERTILVQYQLGRDERHPRRNFLHRALREWHS
ncbi:hypothetical protein [Paraburkholderia bengalensis]|uniref:hypothetical protein n=1 Tax=Paraburkholderia bengalensis TaxID=2747562 RepID=UPI0030155C24